MPKFFTPSGGLLYHLRAWRSRGLWRNFSDSLETWLTSWHSGGGTLLLIGPSGGYTLPTNWLRRFDQVLAVDLDPLAPWFFKKNHPGVDGRFQRRDFFWRNGRLSFEELRHQRQMHPHATVLFCNVLGQLPLEGTISDDDMAAFLTALPGELAGVKWASYHDLYTIEPLGLGLQGKLVSVYEGDISVAVKSLGNKSLTITDHLTRGEWTAGLGTRVLGWPLSSRNFHLIEAVHSG